MCASVCVCGGGGGGSVAPKLFSHVFITSRYSSANSFFPNKKYWQNDV